MLTASEAVRLAACASSVCTAASLERTYNSLPCGTKDPPQAHWTLSSLMTKNDGEAKRSRHEIEERLGALPERFWDAPEARQAIVSAVAPHLREGSFEALTFALGLAASDLLVAARTADSVGMVVDLPGDPASRLRAEGLKTRFREALGAVAAAKADVIAAVAAFRKAVRGRRLSPAVAVAAGALASLARKSTPELDGARSRQLYRPGETWWQQLHQALWAFEKAFSFPAEPAEPSPASPEETEALADLLANPDDDEARLTWAALAEEREEPRATLVREQMKLREERRKSPYYARYEPPVARSLMERHPEWSAGVRKLGVTRVQYRRGFVEWISIDAGAFLENATALYAAAPILHVRLTGVADRLAEILESGVASRLLSMDLSGEGLSDRHVDLLAQAAGLGSLRALDLRKNRISVAGARALYASTSLASLVYAPLDGNPCGGLYASDYTADEYPLQIWVSTSLGERLEKELGKRTWAFPWADEWPPDLDVLTARSPSPL